MVAWQTLVIQGALSPAAFTFFASAFLCGQEGPSFSVPLGVASTLQQRWTWVPSIHSVLLGGDGISIQLQGVTQYLAQSPPVVFML